MVEKEKISRYRTLSQNLSPTGHKKPRDLSTDSKEKKSFEQKPIKRSEFTKTKVLNDATLTQNNQAKETLENKTTKKEAELGSIQESKNLKAFYRSRYSSLIISIQENNKQKLLQKEQEEVKLKKKKEKLKDELGLSNVKSKFNEIPIEEEAKISEIKQEKLLKAKNNLVELENTKNPEEIRIKKEAAEKIVKRAQEYLSKLAEKRVEEQKKEEEAQIREAKLKIALRDAILAKAHDESEITKKKSEKLLSHPKKILLTDISLYKKRYKLKESDKIFIIVGCYPDIRKALKLRGD